MSNRCASPAFFVANCVLAATVLVGCGGESPTVPRNDAEPSFYNIWPAAVGNHWTYEVVTVDLPGSYTLYPTAEEVPPLPSMNELYSTLTVKRVYNDPEVYRGTYHLRFSEDISPSAEIVALRLNNQMVDIAGHPYPPSPLWLGQVWMRSATRIAYNVAGFVGWVHLEGALAPGHEFSVELPSITTMELTARVWRTFRYSVLDIAYSNCIECFYVLDEGVQREGTAYETEGYYRKYTYGVVVYAPELGPVYFHEMNMPSRGVWNNRAATLSAFANEGAPPAAVAEHP
jgi:hypothetical protein